jgi:hypothetical protein
MIAILIAILRNHCAIHFKNLEFQTGDDFKNISNSSSFYATLVPSIIFNMEADCEESSSERKVSQEMVDLTQILTTLSHQITNQNQAIQDQQVVQDNEDFKREIRTELDSIRQMITNQQTALDQTPNSTSCLRIYLQVCLGLCNRQLLFQ